MFLDNERQYASIRTTMRVVNTRPFSIDVFECGGKEFIREVARRMLSEHRRVSWTSVPLTASRSPLEVSHSVGGHCARAAVRRGWQYRSDWERIPTLGGGPLPADWPSKVPWGRELRTRVRFSAPTRSPPHSRQRNRYRDILSHPRSSARALCERHFLVKGSGPELSLL